MGNRTNAIPRLHNLHISDMNLRVPHVTCDCYIASMKKITIKYANRHDGTPDLLADIAWVPDGKPKPLIAVMHGYSGAKEHVALDLEQLAPRGVVAIAPDMRGRGASGGEWDSCGMDVHDIVEAMEYAIAGAPELAGEINVQSRHIVGYSGGGANAIFAACRFPDYFRSATSFFGISDFSTWYRSTSRIDAKKVLVDAIGSPKEFPGRMAARNMIAVAGNAVRTRMKCFWDVEELQCPPPMIEAWVAAYLAAGGIGAQTFISKPGDARRWIHGYRTDNPDLTSADKVILVDVLASPKPGELDIPPCGDLWVPGYVQTRHFGVYLAGQKVEGVARARYDLRGAKPLVELIDAPPGPHRIVYAAE